MRYVTYYMLHVTARSRAHMVSKAVVKVWN